MENCKIFSKIHGAYEESFHFLKFFGIFGIKNQTRFRKFVVVFTVLAIVVYVLASLYFGYTSVKDFGQFVEHTTISVSVIEVTVRLINIAVHQRKIVEIAESFQELKKFDEDGIVKKAEISLNRMLKICVIGTILTAEVFCVHRCFFYSRNLFLGWIKFSNEDISKMIGVYDLFVIFHWVCIWINCQKILFLAYTQLTAHLKCLIVKFSKIDKPKNAEDSKKNLEKLHEIIEIHQKLKR
jgi:hypothetical protein